MNVFRVAYNIKLGKEWIVLPMSSFGSETVVVKGDAVAAIQKVKAKVSKERWGVKSQVPSEVAIISVTLIAEGVIR